MVRVSPESATVDCQLEALLQSYAPYGWLQIEPQTGQDISQNSNGLLLTYVLGTQKVKYW